METPDEVPQQPAFLRKAATAAEQHTKEWIRAALREVVCCVLQSCIQQQSEFDVAVCQTACDIVVQAWKEQYRAGLTDASQHSVVVEWMDAVLEQGRDSLYMKNPPPKEPDSSTATTHGSSSSLPTVQHWTQLRDIAAPTAKKDTASLDYTEVHSVLDDSIARHHASPAWCRSFLAQIPGRLHSGANREPVDNADDTEQCMVLRRKRKRSQAQLASSTRNATLKSTVPRPPSPPPRPPDDDVPLTLTPADIVTTTRRFLPPDDDDEPPTTARMMASLGRLGTTPRHRQWRIFPKQLQKHVQYSHRVVQTIHPGTGQFWMDCNANGYVVVNSTMTTMDGTQEEQVYMFRSMQISLLDEDTTQHSHDDTVDTDEEETPLA